MNITVVSIFSNATSYLERYFEQMDDFQRLLETKDHNLFLVVGWGDSTDGTGTALVDEITGRFDADLFDVSHGGPVFGSIVHPERFKQLAKIGNKLWRHVPKSTDLVMWLESDLIWQASTLGCLLNDVEALTSIDSSSFSRVVVAPMIKHRDGRFYDTWAYRLNGERFQNDKPYHPMLHKEIRFYEMDSVGSCLLMPAKYAKAVQWPEEDVVVGLCRELRDLGCRIVLDSHLEVYHP